MPWAGGSLWPWDTKPLAEILKGIMNMRVNMPRMPTMNRKKKKQNFAVECAVRGGIVCGGVASVFWCLGIFVG